MQTAPCPFKARTKLTMAVQIVNPAVLMRSHCGALCCKPGDTLGAKRLLPLGVRDDPRRPVAGAPLLPLPSPACCTSRAAALAACLRSVTSACARDRHCQYESRQWQFALKAVHCYASRCG